MSDEYAPDDLKVEFSIPQGIQIATQAYRILLIADFAGSSDGRLVGEMTEGVINVTPNSFADVFTAASPKTSFVLRDPVSADRKFVEVSLQFDSLGSFRPQQIADQVTVTKALLQLRDRFMQRLRGETSADDLATDIDAAVKAEVELTTLREFFEATQPANASLAEPSAEQIFDQLDLGDGAGGEATSHSSEHRDLASQIASGEGALTPQETTGLRETVSEIDRRLNSWLNAIVHAPQVQGIESAWRGLHRLVSNIDFRAGVRLSVMHASRECLEDRLVALLIDPVFDQQAEAPALIAVDHMFGNTTTDYKALDMLAEHAFSLPAGVLVGVSPGFLGVKYAWQIATLPPIRTLFDQWQFAKWNALRRQVYARSLGVVFGRCLLRAPYGDHSASGADFEFRETCLGEQDLVWSSGAVAGAFTAARSFAETGWPCGIAGAQHGRIDALPHCQGGKSGDKQFGPADHQTPESRVDELAFAGINVVNGLPNAEAVFANGLTAAKPASLDAQALLEVSLPYQLFAGRLASLLWALKPHLQGQSAEAITQLVDAHLRHWLAVAPNTEPDTMSVQVRSAQNDPNAMELAVTAAPPAHILPGGIPAVLGYRILKT